MIKKILLTLLIIIGFIIYFLYFTYQDQKLSFNQNDSISLENQSQSNSYIDLNYEEKVIRVIWHKVGEINKMHLYPNFEKHIPSSDFLDNNNCRSLFSGGFYTPESKPIGLFISEGEKLASSQKNVLFNGYFSISYQGNVEISSQVSFSNPRIALQSGPLLFIENRELKLNLFDDKQSRRIVLGKTIDNEIIFLAIYNPSSVFLGPLLSDLPSIITDFEMNSIFDFESVINLDGGSASFFYNTNHKLEEIVSVGSYFCEIY